MYKKGYSTGWSWLLGLIFILISGILYIVFDQVVVVWLVPAFKAVINSTIGNPDPGTIIVSFSNIDKYVSYFHLMPYILFFVGVFFMVVSAIKKDGDSIY